MSKEMEEQKIRKLMDEIEICRQAIQDAKDALACAEMELDAELDTEFEKTRN